MRTRLISGVLAFALLVGCDRLGVPDRAKEAAGRDADARATGSACRHAGRAIEDCYALNPKDDRAQVFAGWKEMNDYMRENKIDTVKPEIASSTPPPPEIITENADGEKVANPEEKTDGKASAKASAEKSDKTSEKESKSGKSKKE